MATLTAPTGIVYAFDEVLFQITGATQVCVITISGINVSISPVSGKATFNASGILIKLFSQKNLLNGETQKVVSWSAKEGETVLSSGSFTAVYGSNQTITLISETGKTLNLRWIDRSGTIQTTTLNIHTEETGLDDIQTANVDGIKMVTFSTKNKKITAYAASVDLDTFNLYAHIQDSYVISVETSSGWLSVEVDAKKYKNTFKPYQDFDITIKLPSKQ